MTPQDDDAEPSLRATLPDPLPPPPDLSTPDGRWARDLWDRVRLASLTEARYVRDLLGTRDLRRVLSWVATPVEVHDPMPDHLLLRADRSVRRHLHHPHLGDLEVGVRIGVFHGGPHVRYDDGAEHHGFNPWSDPQHGSLAVRTDVMVAAVDLSRFPGCPLTGLAQLPLQPLTVAGSHPHQLDGRPDVDLAWLDPALAEAERAATDELVLAVAVDGWCRAVRLAKDAYPAPRLATARAGVVALLPPEVRTGAERRLVEQVGPGANADGAAAVPPAGTHVVRPALEERGRRPTRWGDRPRDPWRPRADRSWDEGDWRRYLHLMANVRDPSPHDRARIAEVWRRLEDADLEGPDERPSP